MFEARGGGGESAPPGRLKAEAERRTVHVRTLALYSVALLFLGLVLWRSEIWNAGDDIDDISVPALIAVPLLSLLPAIPLALRGRDMLAALGYRFSAWALTPVSFYGNTAGFLTPASSGEILRPALFERGFGVPASKGAAIVLFERLFSVYLFALSGLFALSWTGLLPTAASIALVPLFLAAIFAPMVVVRWMSGRAAGADLRRFLPRFLEKRATAIEEAGSTVQALVLSPRLAASFASYSALTFALMLLQYWVLLEGLSIGISPAEAWTVLVFANLAGVLSALPLGLGATDAVMVALLGAYDVDLAAAGAVAVLVRCLIHLPTGLLGLASYLTALRQKQPGPEAGQVEAVAVLATNAD